MASIEEIQNTVTKIHWSVWFFWVTQLLVDMVLLVAVGQR